MHHTMKCLNDITIENFSLIYLTLNVCFRSLLNVSVAPLEDYANDGNHDQGFI